MWPRYYILSDRVPFAVDLMTWARWFETADRHVVKDDVGRVRVSTIFLGLDHNWGRGEPILFETMVFGGPLNGEMRRYTSYADAERGHQEVLTEVKKAAAQIKAIADAAHDGR